MNYCEWNHRHWMNQLEEVLEVRGVAGHLKDTHFLKDMSASIAYCYFSQNTWCIKILMSVFIKNKQIDK